MVLSAIIIVYCLLRILTTYIVSHHRLCHSKYPNQPRCSTLTAVACHVNLQALGALHSEKFVLVTQKGALITALVLVPIGVLWWFSGELFELLINKDIAVMTGKCMQYTIPGAQD
eukprot:3677119-Pyramimonas_sp.AAC.1